METETTISHISLPIFDGANYEAWGIRITVHIEALDLWESAYMILCQAQSLQEL